MPSNPLSVPAGVWIAACVVFVLSLATAPLVPLFDPDEGYYPATATESVDAGRGWDPRLNGEPRWDKPILTYALIEASFAPFGRTVTAARLPSALEGAMLIAIVGIVTTRLCTPRAGVLSASVLATTLGLQVFARVAHPEIGVVLAITCAELLMALWLTWPSAHPPRALALLAGAALGCGVLSKGPVAVALPVLALAVSAWAVGVTRMRKPSAGRDLAWLAVVAIGVAVPWYATMMREHGLPFIEEAVWRHNVVRYTSSSTFGHRAPIWFFVVPTLALMFPWSAFVPVALARVSRLDQSDRGVLRIVMASAALTAFVFYSASASKLPHYALVLLPPLSILIGLYLDDILDRADAIWVYRATAAVLALGALVLAALPFTINRVVGARELLGGAPDRTAAIEPTVTAAVLPAAVALAAGAAAMLLIRPARRAAVTMVVGVVVPLLLIVSAQGLLRTVYPWERLGAELRKTRGPVWLIGPRAPSLTFYAGRPIERISDEEIDEHILPREEGWLIADNTWWATSRSARLLKCDIVLHVGVMQLARVHGRLSAAGSRSSPW